ncbi:MAG: hypothetical protein M3Z25_07035 [Actinomycetota bacterium]|nr:hypothetical protein [Actinomycetota bacterium]
MTESLPATHDPSTANVVHQQALRLTDEQFNELQGLARELHLPMSTMARSWLLERLDQERRAG